MNTDTNLPEKIETILMAYFQRRISVGLFGSVTHREGRYYVTADNRDFVAWTDERGHWNIREGDVVASDASILDAASMLIGADLVRKGGRI